MLLLIREPSTAGVVADQKAPGAIGYVGLAYAVQNNVIWAALRNQAGQYLDVATQASQAGR